MLFLIALFACTSPEPDDGPGAPIGDDDDDTTTETATTDTGGSTTPSTTDTATFTVGGTGDTGSTATTGDTGPTEPAYDCTQPWPKQPLSVTTLTNFTSAEDFDFDAEGYVVSVENSDLFGKDPYGNIKVYTPNISSWTAGTRALATGDFVVADANNGELVLVDGTTGAKSVIMAGLAYPNGVEVDADHNVYVAENSGDRVNRVNAYDPYDREVIATGVSEPNGLILSPDQQTLYIGSFGGGVLYAVDRDPKGGWLTPRVFYEPDNRDNGFDGINVDICGNVYFTEWITGKVYRVSPDGQEAGLVAELDSSWIPNLRWGVGVAGWDPDVLYVTDRDQSRMFAIEVGIPGMPHLLAP
jgi:streptogramin lyase